MAPRHTRRGGTEARARPSPQARARAEAARKIEEKHAAHLATRREAYARKQAQAARETRKHAAHLAQRRARALQKRDPAAFAEQQRAILDRNKKRRDRYAEKKSKVRIRVVRDRLLGNVSTGEGPHGRDRNDWMALRAMHRAKSAAWREFLAACQEEGWSDREAADEWYSPEM